MSLSFRRLAVGVAIFSSLSLAVAAPVAAQTDTAVDIAAIGDDVLAADVDTLIEGLQEPIADRDLPDGITEAEYVAPEDVSADLGLLDEAQLEGTLGSAAYVLVGDPDELGGEEVTVSIQYVAYDEADFGDDPVGDFVEGAQGGLGDVPEGSEASAEAIEIEEEDAALISLSMADGGANVVAQYIAIPVGNVFVFAAITVSGSEEVDIDTVFDATEALTLSAIEYLGEVAADS